MNHKFQYSINLSFWLIGTLTTKAVCILNLWTPAELSVGIPVLLFWHPTHSGGNTNTEEW